MDGKLFPSQSPKNWGEGDFLSDSRTPKFRTKYRTNLFYPEVGAPTGATTVHLTFG